MEAEEECEESGNEDDENEREDEGNDSEEEDEGSEESEADDIDNLPLITVRPFSIEVIMFNLVTPCSHGLCASPCGKYTVDVLLARNPHDILLMKKPLHARKIQLAKFII